MMPAIYFQNLQKKVLCIHFLSKYIYIFIYMHNLKYIHIFLGDYIFERGKANMSKY